MERIPKYLKALAPRLVKDPQDAAEYGSLAYRLYGRKKLGGKYSLNLDGENLNRFCKRNGSKGLICWHWYYEEGLTADKAYHTGYRNYCLVELPKELEDILIEEDFYRSWTPWEERGLKL